MNDLEISQFMETSRKNRRLNYHILMQEKEILQTEVNYLDEIIPLIYQNPFAVERLCDIRNSKYFRMQRIEEILKVGMERGEYA